MAAAQIDLNKLELGSLQRYQEVYKLSNRPAANRDDLVALVVGHLSSVAVDEDETLIRFAIACRRNGQRLALSGVKKPRAGSVRPRGR